MLVLSPSGPEGGVWARDSNGIVSVTGQTEGNEIVDVVECVRFNDKVEISARIDTTSKVDGRTIV